MNPDSKQQTGQTAEATACEHLQQHGLQLIERNYHCRQGEIDLIMQDGNYTVFVEVRYRRNSGFGSAAESVDQRKQRKIITTASHYLQQHSNLAQQPARFDVVSMSPQGNETVINWIQDAFQVT